MLCVEGFGVCLPYIRILFIFWTNFLFFHQEPLRHRRRLPVALCPVLCRMLRERRGQEIPDHRLFLPTMPWRGRSSVCLFIVCLFVLVMSLRDIQEGIMYAPCIHDTFLWYACRFVVCANKAYR